MVPALTIMIGWLLLGEPPTALQTAGLVTVLAGFYLAQRQS
jgi:drug/metabolite transporter (DMT)-like permease